MTISTVRLYHPALWKILWSYRAVLVTLRTIENVVRTNIYMLGVGPFVVAWTRLPGTRHRQPHLEIAGLGGRTSTTACLVDGRWRSDGIELRNGRNH